MQGRIHGGGDVGNRPPLPPSFSHPETAADQKNRDATLDDKSYL